jgi:hypothetical protein
MKTLPGDQGTILALGFEIDLSSPSDLNAARSVKGAIDKLWLDK